MSHKAKFEKHKVHVVGQDFEVNLDFSTIGGALDRAQHALDSQVWDDVKQYMPHDSGALIEETNVLNEIACGTGIVYCTPDMEAHDYAHYVYEGIVYEDPVYHKGGFYSPNYGWWSRPGVTKVPSGRMMTYSSPSAQPHWDEVAVNNHATEWAKVAQRALEW